MTRAANRQHEKETKPNAQQGIEDRLHADAVDDVDEQSKSEEEGESLQPDEGARETVGSQWLSIYRRDLPARLSCHRQLNSASEVIKAMCCRSSTAIL